MARFKLLATQPKKGTIVKPILNFFAISLASSLAVGTARADFEVSASLSVHAAGDFYAPLAPSGEWLEVGTYGRCWRPTSVAVEWRPSFYGHLVWTDWGWDLGSGGPGGRAC